jgi:hypothetical protein
MASTEGNRARRLFRILAAVVAFVCFVMVGASRFFLDDNWLFGAIILFITGLMMAAIATTGYWPRRQ